MLRAHIEGQTSLATKSAYSGDLRLFFIWRGPNAPTSDAALEELFALRRGDLVVLLNRYRAYMVEKFAPATVNRRLAAVKSLLQAGRDAELTQVDPAGLVKGVPSKRYRDTRGPTVDEVKAIMACVDKSTLTGKRDAALLRLFWENALRRAEIAACNIEDFDPKRLTLSVRRKGYGMEPQLVTLTKRAVKTVEEYIDARAAGKRLANGEPLFANLSRSAKINRLTGKGLWYILVQYSLRAIGRPVSPHKWRHAGVTTVLKESKGDRRAARDLGGWADGKTIDIYDDNARDGQGAASELLSKLA